jgi:hypothetical protein
MVDHGTQYLREAIEELKDQRGRLARDTAVLESMISICSGIARQAPGASIVQMAVGLRASAVALYAQPHHTSATAGDLLEECIARLEQELELQFTRGRPPPRSEGAA